MQPRHVVLVLVIAGFVTQGTAQAVELPAPGGRHAVGTTLYHLHDRAREEVWTPQPGDHRELLVQLFYPADPATHGEPAPYIPEAAAAAANLESYFSDAPPQVRIAARLDAPPASSADAWPVIVFSHGMNVSRWAHTNLAQQLASRGFAVVTIDHTYWNAGSAFPDGRVVDIKDNMVERTGLTSDEISYMMREGVMLFAEDQKFVGEAMRTLATAGLDGDERFIGRLDTSKMATMGHSMGGMGSELACINYRMFSACVNLDGAIYDPIQIGVHPAPTDKPFLMFRSEQFCAANERFGRVACEADTGFAKAYLARWRSPQVLLVAGSRHNSFGDLPLIMEWDYAEASRRLQRDLAAMLERFFRRALEPDGQDAAAVLTKDLPATMRVLDLAGIVAKAAAE